MTPRRGRHESSTATPRILVLRHHRDHRSGEVAYLIDRLAEIWRADGLEVRCVKGVGALTPADVLVPQLDLSVLPKEYRQAFEAYSRVVNGKATDISKRAVSQHLVSEEDTYEGAVLVKSDLNFGGIPERRLPPHSIWKTALPAHYGARLARRLGPGRLGDAVWKRLQCLPTGDYQVFERISDVPDGVCRNPRLVLERFLPELHDGRYRVNYYYYYFLFDREFNIRVEAERPIVKGAVAVSIEVAAIPDGLRQHRRRLGFDFGKLDYVLRDGQPVLLDANWTPTIGTLERAGLLPEVLHRLAPGIEAALSSTGCRSGSRCSGSR